MFFEGFLSVAGCFLLFRVLLDLAPLLVLVGKCRFLHLSLRKQFHYLTQFFFLFFFAVVEN